MTSEPIAVTVVIPVLDGAATIGTVLSALAAQAGAPAAAEVIVVDNGSTDATAAIVAAHGVRFLREPRRGPSAARNRGLREARGEIVAFLDDDTVPTRRWLAELLVPFDDLAVVVTGGEVESLLPSSPAQRFAARYWLQRSNAWRPAGFGTAPSGNLAVRRAAALEIGGFDEGLLTAEDVDFSMRLMARFDTRVVHRPRAVVMHRDRETDEELHRQAISYGRGMAELYSRHPEQLLWGWRQRAAVVTRVVGRTSGELVARVARHLGRSSALDVEYATYARRWTWWYWLAFWRQARQRPGRP